MAVVYEKERAPRVEIDPSVEPFLAKRPQLRPLLPPALENARIHFPVAPLRLIVERDPDDYAWETLVFEFDTREEDGMEKALAFMSDGLAPLIRECPAEIVAVNVWH